MPAYAGAVFEAVACLCRAVVHQYEGMGSPFSCYVGQRYTVIVLKAKVGRVNTLARSW